MFFFETFRQRWVTVTTLETSSIGIMYRMGGVVHTYDINEDDLIDGKEFLHDIRKKGSQIVMVFYVTSLWMVLKVILEFLIMIFIRVNF